MVGNARQGMGAAAGDPPALAAALSQTLMLLGGRRPNDALALIAGLPPAQRADPRVAARAAYAFSLLGRIGDALAAARMAMAAPNPDLGTLDLAGNTFTLCQQPREAHDAFQRAVALAPDNPAILFNLATTARFLGRAKEAEDAYDRVIRAAPDSWEAWRNRSDLRRQTKAANHVRQLTDVLASGRPPWEGEVQLSYALGKEYEDLGEHDQAFAAFSRGARTRRAHMRYDVSEDVGAMALIEQTFDAAWCAPGRAASGPPGPVFIVGLPRTGSTLLETMLGRHSMIQPLGELQTFGQALTGTMRQRAARLEAPGKAGVIRASAQLPPEAIGAAYLAGVGPLRDARPAFTDKLPFNFLYAGLIARALPTARIVHLTRDPLDTGFAIYKTLFDEAYPFSYDLAELGAYINAYRRLMAHWRAALDGRIVEVAYEDLVSDAPATLARVLDGLGLAMEPACLAPDRSDAPVMTASASQVRRPVHAGSVGGASRYRRHLQPLIDALDVYDGPV